MSSLQLGNGIAVELIGTVGPAMATILRVGSSALLLLPALFLLRSQNPTPVRQILTYGAVLGLMQLAFYQAISQIPLALAVSIEFAIPLAVSCIRSSSLSLKLLTAGSAAGLLLIANNTSTLSLTGVLWASLTGLLLCFYIRIGTEMRGRTHPLAALSKALLVAFPVVVVGQHVTLLSGPPPIAPVAAQVVVVAVLTIIIPFSLELLAMKSLRPVAFALVSAMDPVLASIVGVVGLNQHLNSYQVSGLIMLTGCAFLAIRSGSNPRSNN
ncbi:EamA family transporter [Paenarthrobacter ureafaciens]|uniref:EamA family transporter n=1 Tax=Paenarthrobacter ureafaciens TaxID=37931 RepID=UPI003B8A6E71